MLFWDVYAYTLLFPNVMMAFAKYVFFVLHGAPPVACQ